MATAATTAAATASGLGTFKFNSHTKKGRVVRGVGVWVLRTHVRWFSTARPNLQSAMPPRTLQASITVETTQSGAKVEIVLRGKGLFPDGAKPQLHW
jgi:hypothetical protein